MECLGIGGKRQRKMQVGGRGILYSEYSEGEIKVGGICDVRLTPLAVYGGCFQKREEKCLCKQLGIHHNILLQVPLVIYYLETRALNR